MKKAFIFLSALVILSLNGIAQTIYSGTVSSGQWYRIAQNASGGKRANAVFTLRDAIGGGGHSTVEFRIGSSYNYINGISFTLLNHNYYYNVTFTKVRILTHTTYDAQYLEVYVARSGSVNYSITDNLQSSGWEAVTWGSGSIPSGYTSNEYNINKLFAVGNNDDQFAIERDGKIYTNAGIKFSDGSTLMSANWYYVAPNGSGIDDQPNIQYALDNYHRVSLIPGLEYTLKDRITLDQYNGARLQGEVLNIPINTTVIFDASTGSSWTAFLLYNNTRLTGGGTIVSSRYNGSPQTNWDMNNAKAAIVINGGHCKIDLGGILGFEYGLYLGGAYKPIGNCDIIINDLIDNIYNIYIYPSGTGTIHGFVNGNNIRWSSIAYITEKEDRPTTSYGIYMDGITPNHNTFSGVIEDAHVGLQLVGAFNRFEGLRLEGCNTKIICYDGSDQYGGVEYTRNNYLYGEYGDISGLPIANYTQNSTYQVISVFGWDEFTYLNKVYQQGSLVYSDSRYKNDIRSIQGATNKILSLRGIIYNMKNNSKNSINDSITNYGFIAQELKEILPELVIMNPIDSMYAINYDGVIPVLVEAFKDHDKKIEKKEKEIEELKKQNLEIIDILKSNGLYNNLEISEESNHPILYQNNPNPFYDNTEIKYYLPDWINNACLLIMDMNGKLVKRIEIESKGQNSITLHKGELVPGMYIYSLITDNIEINTLRLIITE